MKILKISMACLFIMAFLFSSATPAFGWGTVNKHAYHFRMCAPPNIPVNDAMVWGTIVVPGPIHPPVLQHAWSNCFQYTGTGILSFWRWVKFGPGATVPPGTCCWFNIDFRDSSFANLQKSWAWFRWTNNGNPVGPWVPLGWRIASPPALYNPAQRPDGSPNTMPMIVRNLQFAVSPTRIANDSTTLDNPIVIALFAGSPDPIRPGPLTVQPDGVMEIPVDPNVITEPIPGGRTVLVKGTVEDESGVQVPFVCQFIAEPNVPTLNQWGLIILALLVIGTAVWVLMRRRARISA